MNTIEIKTYEDACQVNKQDPNNLPNVSDLSGDEAKDVINDFKLKRIIRALNTDQETGRVWKPNWNDGSTKYFPWFEVDASDEKPGGFGFSETDYDNWITDASVGSRLALESSEKVYHLQEHFRELLIECYLIVE